MKDILSYETSVRLKESGFPQPKPEAGQHFYICEKDAYGSICKQDTLFVFVRAWRGHLTGVFFAVTEKAQERGIDFANERVFAPTATDILRELGPYFDISYNCGEFWCRDEKDWNPAEAAAEAWLQLNEK